MDKLKISVRRTGSGGENPLPAYATKYSSGADLRAAESCVIQPGERGLVPTGISIAIPEGFEAQIRPRSGLALKHGITIPNSPGTIDADYRGEICVILMNIGKEAFTVNAGDRIAQIVFAPVVQAEFEETDSLDETERGEGGFGSSGKV